jgi:2',3'-cyclic-nucleotide 2'-phosphodiesterase (5'-nucleotidase family)
VIDKRLWFIISRAILIEVNRLFRKTIIAFLLTLSLCAGLRAQTADIDPKAVLDERLGDDDGAAAAILFSANERGNLEVCDCTQPRGGLARRIGYLEAFKKRFKETPVLQVEAGNLFYNSDGYSAAVMLQNSQVVRAYGRWPVDVINLSRYDLIYAQRLFAREGLAERAAEFPAIKSMISANGVFGDAVAPPASYVVKEITGPRIVGAKRKLRVGFIGLAEPTKPGPGLMDAMVSDMTQAARFLVPTLRKKCDVVIIVAHAELNTAMKLAEQSPEADIVIAGNADGLYKPRQVGSTLVLSIAPGNIQQGDLRIYLDKAGRPSFKWRSTDLDSFVPSDPAALAFTDEARRERENARVHR